MGKYKVEYKKDMDIQTTIEKIVKLAVENDEYKHEIIFVDKNGKETANYRTLESYKNISQNLSELLKTIEEQKQKINNEINSINKMLGKK